MRIESLVSTMMSLNVKARLWHWITDAASHHTTFEQFLTQNEALTDSLMESALGNDVVVDFTQVGVETSRVPEYRLTQVNKELKNYRSLVRRSQKEFEEIDSEASTELITILDDVAELTSKTVYLLKLK